MDVLYLRSVRYEGTLWGASGSRELAIALRYVLRKVPYFSC